MWNRLADPVRLVRECCSTKEAEMTCKAVIRLLMPIGTAILSICSTGVLCDDTVPNSRVAVPREELEEILWWLPADMEAVYMWAQPFVIEPVENSEAAGNSDNIGHYAGPFMVERYNHILYGRRVVARVAGERRFRPPKGLGMMRREGADIWRFSEGLGADGKSLLESILDDAPVVEVIENCSVAVFSEKYEQDIWKTYIAIPRPEVVVAAQDSRSLREVLQRMNRKGKTRAFPADRPEWKYLDPDAREWRVRHYDRTAWTDDPVGQQSPQVDWTSPFLKGAIAVYDPDAIGLAFSSPREGHTVAWAYYLSNNKHAVAVATESWQRPDFGSVDCQVRSLEPGVVEISHPFDDPESIGAIYRAVSVHLGWGARL
jgi:hypothetical protein